MQTLISNEFFEVSRTDEIAVLDIKEKVFEFITDIELSGKLMDFLRGLDHDETVKALIFFNSPESLNDEKYEAFIRRILADQNPCEGKDRPNFSEKNTRFREINILNKLIRAIGSLQTLVISGLQGTVVTPFIGASLVADFRYASEDVVLSMIHNKYNLHPSGGLPFFLSNFFHHSKALEIQMTDRIDAQRIMELGLVNKLIPSENFREQLIREVEPFTKLSYCTIRDTKRLTNFNRKDLNNYFEYEASLLNL